jgi:hypothetical protein
MIIFLTASSDTYITNKIVEQTFRTGSNTGRAGTLDLFTLYDESNIKESYEKSRILIKFDDSRLSNLTSSIVNPNNFKAFLNLKSINLGNSVPNNFLISSFPLAKKFEEGFGRDVISFSDYDISNYVICNSEDSWSITGCNSGGQVGAANTDFYTHFINDANIVSLESNQYFEDGTEDLMLDVTVAVSSSIAGIIENHGFRIAFSGSQDEDQITRFVKRFGSRHVKNKNLSPKLIIKFDDSKVDFRDNLFFDTTGSLYLDNKNINLKNINGSSITGSDCIFLTLSTGSYSAAFTGSQEIMGDYIPGSYITFVSISTNDPGIVSGSSTLSQHALASGSITFLEEWHDKNKQKIFYTNYIKAKLETPSPNIFNRSKIISRCVGPTNIEDDSIFLLKVYFYDLQIEETSSKFYAERESLKLSQAYYRFRDAENGELICDFENCTKLSLGSSCNYANVSSTVFLPGRTYVPEFKINYLGNTEIIMDKNYYLKIRI